MSETTGANSVGSAAYPPAAQGWYVVVILTLAYVVSFLDRQILALLVEPIKHDLEISDFQMSLLLGLAFAIFYTFLGIPFGRMADKYSRRAIIAIGISLWCLMTAASGLARNYTQLFLARIGVGVGEASLTPSALSLISDYFPRETRGQAISFYMMGVSVGAGIAMVIGGQVIALAKPITLPFIGDLYAWQTVFLIVGLPGILIAFLMATIKEPKRIGKIRMAMQSGEMSEEIPLATVAKFLLERWRTYGSLFIGMSVVTILGYSYFFWIPTMFVRTWQWTIPEVSMVYGLLMLVFGPLGVNFGGWLADTLYKRGHKNGHALVTFYGALAMIPSYTLVPLMPSGEWAMVMMVPAIVSGAVITATGATSIMMIAPNQMRGQATALFYFVINLLGLTIGPSAVAYITDFVFYDEAALRYSISIVSFVAGILATLFLFYLLPHYGKSIKEAEAWMTDG